MSLAAQADLNNLNNLRDILQTYNKITEACFQRCATNFNSRDLTDTETSCVLSCAGKFINTNQRIMQTFMEIQVKKQQQAYEEQQQQEQPAVPQITATEMAATAIAGAGVNPMAPTQAPTMTQATQPNS